MNNSYKLVLFIRQETVNKLSTENKKMFKDISELAVSLCNELFEKKGQENHESR